MAANSNANSSIWIYHERQEELLCGQHALNNLAQQGPSFFSESQLTDIAHELDVIERSVLEPSAVLPPSHNVSPDGNFSIQVLQQALEEEFHIRLQHLSVMISDRGKSMNHTIGEDVTNFQGFLCHKEAHWFALRQVGGRFWNLNSMLERPSVVSHFSIGTEVTKWQKQGYNVYGIDSGLPSGGIKVGNGHTRIGTWHRMSDLLEGKSTEIDPWEGLSGKGMRLDGRGPLVDTFTPSNSRNRNTSVGALGATTGEDEDFQRALQASLESASASEQNHRWSHILVAPEPEIGIRLQLKLPSGTRLVRRFNGHDSVEVLYAFVHQREGGSSNKRVLELLYGFPPKDLKSLVPLTVEQAKLAGETILGRYVK